ncbi:hypothetical protein ASPCADRAFT_205226 [Aspergillus carbonarius ITEM 5010]|uniref:Uncharacterized protein n=1 Tax=Aspergillus carbonarius (strain ITEM 5010) TaxID=602072 RepID=A0A1R3RU26_ASPC5|nr:hypothetical protein ASPCADRAFT_205226 [Aspergillus carbonarius ITEM 5010]
MQRLRSATRSIISSGETFAREHTTALAVGSTGLALATAPITGPAILGMVGFSATGPVAASLAAVWQSSIGAVQAGSLFATLQGAAMGGTAAGAFTTASNIGLGMVGSAAIGSHWSDTERTSRMEDHAKSCEDPELHGTDDSLEKEWAKFLQINLS